MRGDLRVVVVGCGDISAIHLAAIGPAGGRLVAMVDTDPERARDAGERLGVPAFTDVGTALDAVEADVVHVCTPHDQHLAAALPALERGRAVLTEKPLGHTLAEAEQLVEAAERAGTTVGVCFQNRYNATSRGLHEVVTSGELGAVVAATATVAWSRTSAYYDAKAWAGRLQHAGGGALINQSIHTLDLLLWLLGPAERVHGTATQLEPLPGVDVEDTVALALDHVGGVRSAMWATNTNGVNSPVTLDLVCERGTATLRGDLLITPADGEPRVVREAVATGERAYWGLSHASLIADFYEHVRGGRPFWIDPRQALASQQVLEQVYARRV